MTMNEMGARAKTAARALANAGALKESALLHAAGALWQRREELLAANALDVQAGREAGMSRALLDRLSLTEARIQNMAAAVEAVAKSADPVGKTLSGQRLPNGLQLEKVTVPLGVIGIIYEARPNVTSDAAALWGTPSSSGAGRRPSAPTRRWSRCCGRPWRKGGCLPTASSWWRTPPASPPKS